MFKKIAMGCAILLVNSTVVFADSLVPYLGADLGLDYGRWQVKDVTTATRTSSASGTFGNLFLGVAWSPNESFYVGLEGFGSISSTHSSHTQINTSTIPATINIRMRDSYGVSVLPGFKFSQASLFYLRFGFVRSLFNFHQTIVPVGSSSNLHRTIASGGQIGIGLQTGISTNWAVRGEYDYNSYRNFTVFGNKVTPHDNQFKVGLLYTIC